MKRNMVCVFCTLLAAFAFALPSAGGSREINLDTLKKPLAPYVTDMEKKDAAWVRKQYHLDNAACEQALVHGVTSVMGVNEIAILGQANKTKREALQGLHQERASRQLKSFRGYAPRQSALLERAAAYKGGRYVVIPIHPQQSRLRQLSKRA